MKALRAVRPEARLGLLGGSLSLAASAWAGDAQKCPSLLMPRRWRTPDAAAASIPGVKKEDVRPTPVAGVFEVRRGADIVYMSGDGQYVFTGDLYNVSSHNNLTEAHRRVLRQKLIEAIPESQMVIFSPPQPKYTVTVFTDVDCAVLP
jgi:protein-disulfide isomerase